MLDFIIFAVTFLAVLLIAIIWLYPSSKSVTTVPGLSPSTQEDGNFGDIMKAGSFHEFLMDLHSQFGSIAGFWYGQTYIVSIASPELLKQHNHVFDRPPMLFKPFEELIGSRSLQYANGSDGRSRRRLYDPMFAFDKKEKYMCIFKECVEKVESKWMEKGEDDHISLSEHSFIYAIDAALRCIAGDFYNDEKIFLRFSNAYHLVWNEMEARINNPTEAGKNMEKFEKDLDFMRSFIKKILANRTEAGLYLQNNLLIDVLIENSPDDLTAADDIMTFFIGSFHTTSNLITWAVYFLATHKDVQEKLHKEVKSLIGDKGYVDENNFSDFVYLKQVMEETLRCAVIAPWAARVQEFDSELGGHKIPKNTPVIHALGVTLKSEEFWTLPNKFDPDRFSPENKAKMSTHSFMPFGFAGKRKCPAYQFAYWDAAVFIATMVSRFEISMCADQVVTPVHGLVTHPQDEIWIKVKKRT